MKHRAYPDILCWRYLMAVGASCLFAGAMVALIFARMLGLIH